MVVSLGPSVIQTALAIQYQHHDVALAEHMKGRQACRLSLFSFISSESCFLSTEGDDSH